MLREKITVCTVFGVMIDLSGLEKISTCVLIDIFKFDHGEWKRKTSIKRMLNNYFTWKSLSFLSCSSIQRDFFFRDDI